jgi:hypothetical protein
VGESQPRALHEALSTDRRIAPYADPGRLVWVSGANAKNDATLHRIEKILGVLFGHSQQL